MEQTSTPARPAPTADEKTLALAAHGLTFLDGGLVGPLVIYFIKRNESDFVAFHALQSLAFTLAFAAVSLLTCGLGAVALGIPFIVFEIIACVRAYEGEWYELPVVGRWARSKHPGHAAQERGFGDSAPPAAAVIF